jgi:DNA-binding CsgD family transcriptional regulator
MNSRQAIIEEIAAVADKIPGVIIIHDIPEFSVQYMSPFGLKLLGREWSEIKGISNQEYHKRFFNEADAKDYVPKLLKLLQENTDEVVSYFQQVRTSNEREWDWYMSMTKILQRDENNRPDLSITIAMKIDPTHYFTARASKLLEENVFIRKNYEKYAKLSDREQEVLKLLVLGKSAPEIADELFLSTATVETHRRNIKKKLQTGNMYELSTYARAFNLI